MSNSDQKPSTEFSDLIMSAYPTTPNPMIDGTGNLECYCCVDCGRPLARQDLVFLAEGQKPPQRCGGCWIKAGRPEGNQ